ncbi:conserved hypothetical protein [Vibrio coralliirubri]|uniref:DUF6651 domain-containing protein n=1 Tax=Vibrio coralliirubri TaxID=1516159 RepID=UPI00062F2A21|nr:DUF6651 domain-containing protein [Vibrio coralliirubri]CDT52714.1 conserved hypothetical protein [Vibrio coralliirubri]
MTLKTKKNSLLSVMENSGSFKAQRPSEMLFGCANPADVYRAKYSSICFVDGEGEGDATPPADSTPPADNTPPEDNGDSEDKPNLSDSEAKLLKDVMKWKEKARSAEKSGTEKTQELEAQLNSLKGIVGEISEDDLKAIISDKNARDIQELEKKGEYDAVVDQMRTQHTKDLELKDTAIQEKDDLIAQLQEQLKGKDSQVEDLTIGRHFADSGFIKERSTLPLSMMKKEFGAHFEIQDGSIVGFDKPRGVEGRAPLVDGQANSLGFEAAIERLITSHPESKALLRSNIKPGSGSRTLNHDATGEKQVSGVSKIAQGLAARNK